MFDTTRRFTLILYPTVECEPRKRSGIKYYPINITFPNLLQETFYFGYLGYLSWRSGESKAHRSCNSQELRFHLPCRFSKNNQPNLKPPKGPTPNAKFARIRHEVESNSRTEKEESEFFSRRSDPADTVRSIDRSIRRSSSTTQTYRQLQARKIHKRCRNTRIRETRFTMMDRH